MAYAVPARCSIPVKGIDRKGMGPGYGTVRLDAATLCRPSTDPSGLPSLSTPWISN
jgi:hypothetical protein